MPATRYSSYTRRALLVVSLSLVLALPAVAQTVTGTIQGTVADATGAALPGVTVTVRNVDTGHQRVVVTNERGFYNAPFVPIGEYTVRAELSGMNPVQKTKVDVGLNHTRIIDFALTVSGVEETITVVAEEPRINQVNAEIKGSLTDVEIIDKPTPPGTSATAFLTLAETFAGFQENPTSGQNNPTLSSGSSINFGAGTRGASFQINGVNNDDSSENQHRQGVTLSAIKEFQVLTSNFSAEFGRAYGAIVLVQTKQGTNEFAGDLFGFFSDAQWNEKSYFARHLPKGESKREQYGFTAGFPIVRDRLFGFGAYEENKFQGPSFRSRSVFTEEELKMPRLTRGNDTPENRAWIESVLARFPSGPNDPVLGERVYSAPTDINQPDGNYSLRLDFDATMQHHVTGRYQYSDQLRERDEIIVGEFAIQDHNQSTFGFNWTQVFNDWLVGEARYGFGYRDTNVTIPGGDDTPVIRFLGASRGPIIGNAGAFPILREQTDHQFVYNLSAMFFENHTLKAGVDIRREQLDDRADNFHRGYWQFRSTCMGETYESPFHAFLDGCVRNYVKAYGPNFLENRLDEGNFYIEDSWQALSNLTLNLGARYELVGAAEEVENRVPYGYDDDSYVDPRVSFAYTIDKDSRLLNWLTGGANRSVIRGGWGSFHGRVFQSIFSQGGASIRSNPPYALLVWAWPSSLNISKPDGDFVFTPGEVPSYRYSYTKVDPNLETPSTDQWNLTFEREMPWNSSIRLSYTNKHGNNLLRYVPTNLPLSPLDGPVLVVDHPNNAPREGHPDLRGQTITTINPDPCAGTGLPGVPTTTQCPNAVPIGDNEISQRVPRINERRPDPRYRSLTTIVNGAESKYEAMQVEWIKRYSDNLHFQVSYTYSESRDNNSEATYVGAGDTNSTGPDKKYAWGPSRFDTPHRFTFYGSYKLPFFKDRKDLVGMFLGGWQIAPVYRYATGTPFTVFAPGVDLNWDGFGESRPVLLQPIEGRKIDDPSTSQQRLPVDAFRRPTLGDTADMLAGRNAFRADDTERLDVGIYKSLDLPAGMTLRLQIDVFNALNFEQWGFPNTDITSKNFGRITSMDGSYQPRTYQVGFRLMY
ncbi:MAG: carboxypeptidase regulatory-like domain-containing protein [Thermoanaerobaculia bacterium]